MIDLYLRAGNAGALASACPFLRGETETGDKFWITSGDGFSLDVIGAIVTTPGTYDDDGKQTKPASVDNRFHVNLRCTEEIAAKVPDTVRIHPENPSRVWA